jgi:hypothetical protein
MTNEEELVACRHGNIGRHGRRREIVGADRQ